MHKSIFQQLSDPGVVSVPGVYDGVSARIAEQLGFGAAFVSGAGLAMSRYGRPDLGLIGMSEFANTIAAMTETTAIPLIVDIDTGFGNALNVARTVQMMERSGARAVQMEDQTFPKRCGHIKGKTVVPAGEMVGKIKAAVDTRQNEDTLIIARTDAIAVEGLVKAMDRAELYLEAGADALFLEAPQDTGQMSTIAARFSQRIPLVHNFVEGGKSPISSTEQLDALGYKIGLFPLAFMHAAIPAGRSMLQHLKETGQTKSWPGDHDNLQSLNTHVGLQDWLDKSDTYG